MDGTRAGRHRGEDGLTRSPREGHRDHSPARPDSREDARPPPNAPSAVSGGPGEYRRGAGRPSWCCRPAVRARRGHAGAGRDPRARAGAGPARPDDGLAVRVLPGQRRADGRATSARPPSPGSASSCAATRTCRTSGCSPPPSDGWSSTSTTSTRRCPAPGSGTSSGWPRAWPWPAAGTGTPTRSARDRGRGPSGATGTPAPVRRHARPRRLVRRADVDRSQDVCATRSGASRREGAWASAVGEGPRPRQPEGAAASSPRSSTGGCGSRPTRRCVVPLADLLPHGAGATELQRSAACSPATGAPCPATGGHLLDQFELVDMARKVVGVGSVGTRCWIVLLRGRDEGDPLFLQVKEAQRSVLAPTCRSGCDSGGTQPGRARRGRPAADAGGERHVPRLGPDRGPRRPGAGLLRPPAAGQEGLGRRGADGPRGMALYGELCGWTLARAHARSGDPIAIAAYLGDDDVLRRGGRPSSPRSTPTRTRRTTPPSWRPSDAGRLPATLGV